MTDELRKLKDYSGFNKTTQARRMVAPMRGARNAGRWRGKNMNHFLEERVISYLQS